MKPALLLIPLLLAGCAHYKAELHDLSTTTETSETGVVTVTKRDITTDLAGTAVFSSAQNIARLKASQTDKTQSFGAENVTQQGATNTVATLRALADLLGAMPK